MGFFEQKSRPILGIDVSSTTVKVLELGRHGDRYRVEHYAKRDLPANAVVENNIADVDAVAATIKAAVSQSRSKLKDAGLAVAGSAVITKVIDMPAGSNDDALESFITIEADKYIPYPLDEVSIDFEVLGPSDDNADQMKVLLAACRKENIELRAAVLEAAGLTPRIIDVEAYTVERAYSLIADEQEDQQDQVVAVIDMGATMTTLSVLVDQKTIYTREQLFGGKHLTEEIQRRYGLSYEDADLTKLQGGLPDDYESEVLEPFKDTVVQQITRSLQFFFSSSQYNEIDRIIFAGGAASMDGLAQLVEERLGTRVVVANPFASMSIASRVNSNALANDAPGLMIATGLAMRSFD